MREQQVNKLYSKLTPHEQAALAFEASIQLNGKEVDLILSGVERRDYTAPHIEYIARTQGLIQFSLTYGLLFWKRLCQIATVTILASDNIAVDEQYLVDDFTSMNSAFEEVCKQLGVDVSIIRKFAECGCYKPLTDGNINSELLQQYIDCFKKISYLEK